MNIAASLPEFMTPSLCFNILRLLEEPSGPEIEDGDLVVRSAEIVTLKLENGSESTVRDIFVLGQLIIFSEDPDKKEATLQGRNLVVCGVLDPDNLILNMENYYQVESYSEFLEELKQRVAEGLKEQREAVNQIGLQSLS